MTEWPEMIALVSPVVGNAFQIKYKEDLDVSKTTRVDTGLERGGVLDDSVQLLDHEVECGVCEAAYLRGVHLWLRTAVMGTFLERLRDARLTIRIDGTKVVDREPVGKFMEDKDSPLPRMPQPVDRVLFEACRLDRDGNADMNRFIGYFCTNGTNVTVDVEGLPCGAGVVEIEVGCRIALYTTREQPREF